ncbi:MAG: hypothetical protein UW73_C0039G0007 [Microgenomates group bacterium GW2011_GWB1_44_8]|nr:MAG: hypothetical protein UW73_C0039G0007 [Microgenomates group bacterium GW2011_GWB1_44_8]
MINKQQSIQIVNSEDVLMSPRKVIQRMGNIFQKYGKARGIKSVRFQKAREAWIASIFSLGYSQITKKAYWIQENKDPKEDPDIFVYSYRDPIEPGEIGVVKEIQTIEVFEYPIYAQLELSEHIKYKLKNKFYHPETISICYIQRPKEVLKLIDVINGLIDLQTEVREVWLLLTLDELPESNFMIARVYMRGTKYPDMLLSYKGDYAELCKINQPDFLQDSRGSRMEKRVNITPSGKTAIVPLPEDLLK